MPAIRQLPCGKCGSAGPRGLRPRPIPLPSGGRTHGEPSVSLRALYYHRDTLRIPAFRAAAAALPAVPRPPLFPFPFRKAVPGLRLKHPGQGNTRWRPAPRRYGLRSGPHLPFPPKGPASFRPGQLLPASGLPSGQKSGSSHRQTPLLCCTGHPPDLTRLPGSSVPFHSYLSPEWPRNFPPAFGHNGPAWSPENRPSRKHPSDFHAFLWPAG